jgi:hypothetical protein
MPQHGAWLWVRQRCAVRGVMTYRVTRANVTSPKIGDVLTEPEINALRAKGVNVTVR